VAGTAVTVNGIGRIVGSSGTSSVGTSSTAAKVAVSTSPSTYTKTEAAKGSAVVVGSCVTVLGSKSSSGSLTATSVSIRAAGPNGCSGFGGRGGSGGGGGGGTGGTGAATAA
jgi:hypothetical protein